MKNRWNSQRTQVQMDLDPQELELLRHMAKNVQKDALEGKVMWLREEAISKCHRLLGKLRVALDPGKSELHEIAVVVPKPRDPEEMN